MTSTKKRAKPFSKKQSKMSKKTNTFSMIGTISKMTMPGKMKKKEISRESPLN